MITNSKLARQRAEVCMSPLDAARLTAEDYPGNIAAMAQRLNKPYETLRKELSPPEGSTAKLGLLDAVRMMTRSSDFRIADAIEAELGRFALPLPELPDGVADDDLAQHLVRISKEFGDVMQETAVRAADGDISDQDLAEIRKHWGHLVAVGDAMLKHLTGRNLAAKPLIGGLGDEVLS